MGESKEESGFVCHLCVLLERVLVNCLVAAFGQVPGVPEEEPLNIHLLKVEEMGTNPTTVSNGNLRQRKSSRLQGDKGCGQAVKEQQRPSQSIRRNGGLRQGPRANESVTSGSSRLTMTGIFPSGLVPSVVVENQS